MNSPELTLPALDFAGFKQMAADYFKRAKSLPVPTSAQLSSGLHMLRIGYLDMTGTDLDRHQAFILLGMAEKRAYEITGEIL